MNIKKYIISTFVLLSAFAYANEPFINPQNLIAAPQGYIGSQGDFSVGYNAANLFVDPDHWSKDYSESQSNISVQYNPFQNAQVGISAVVDQNQDNNVGLEAKYQLYNERGNMPAISVGATQLGTNSDESFYLVGSKRLAYSTKVSLGVGSGKFYSTGGKTRWAKGLLAGVEQDVFGLPIKAEFAGDDINLGTSVAFDSKTRFNLAVTELENLFGDHDRNSDSARVVFGFTMVEPFGERSAFHDVYAESRGLASKEIADPMISGYMSKKIVKNQFNSEILRSNGSSSLFIDGEKIMTLYNDGDNSNMAATSQERAQLIVSRLNSLSAENQLKQLKMKAVNGYFAGVSGDRIVFTITKNDIKGNNESAASLATEWITHINTALSL